MTVGVAVRRIAVSAGIALFRFTVGTLLTISKSAIVLLAFVWRRRRRRWWWRWWRWRRRRCPFLDELHQFGETLIGVSNTEIG